MFSVDHCNSASTTMVRYTQHIVKYSFFQRKVNFFGHIENVVECDCNKIEKIKDLPPTLWLMFGLFERYGHNKYGIQPVGSYVQ